MLKPRRDVSYWLQAILTAFLVMTVLSGIVFLIRTM